MSTLIDTAVQTSNQAPSPPPDDPTSPNSGNGSALTSSNVQDRPRQSSKEVGRLRHVLAVHTYSEPSCLSSDSQKVPSFVGFRNLMVLVLIVSNLRLMIENFKKYGVLICVRCHDYRQQDLVYGSMLYLLVPCHLFVAYIVELAAAQQAKGALARKKRLQDAQSDNKSQEPNDLRTTWYLIAFAHGLNATANLIIASTVVYYYIHHPGIGTLCELHAIIVWLKTCSYAFTNRDLRAALLSSRQSNSLPDLYKSCPYPRNITLGNLCYFWWAPTLVYQPVYPRTSTTRWSFVFKRLAEAAALGIVIWIASAQYAAPLLLNSVSNISNLDAIPILERLMKLSTISLFCWLAGFYAFFHSCLNALAEVMRFGDREFYEDWWNSANIRTYWTTWNKPVYHFMRRHIYSPLVGRGVSRPMAQVIVFIFSGVLHELLVGVPTHNIIGVAFAGMLWQIPLILMTDVVQKIRGINGKVAGNVIFWLTFCLVGQPLAALLYFFAWQAKYGSVSREPKWF